MATATHPAYKFGIVASGEYSDRYGIKPWEAAGLIGLTRAGGGRKESPDRQPVLVGVYNAKDAGLEDSGYATVCEVHGRLVIHTTRKLAFAHAVDPWGWCQVCNGTEAPDEVET